MEGKGNGTRPILRYCTSISFKNEKNIRTYVPGKDFNSVPFGTLCRCGISKCIFVYKSAYTLQSEV